MIRKKVMDNKNVNVNIHNSRLTSFAFKKNQNGIDIKIVGCLEVKSAPSQPYYSKGIVTINHKVFSVFDLQALSGLKPKNITEESCIVLLDPNESFTDFSRAIIVDDVSEMLRIAERNMEGLPIETLFGHAAPIPLNGQIPDFPELSNDPGSEEAALAENQTSIDNKFIANKV